MGMSMVQSEKIRNGQAIRKLCKWCDERCRIEKVYRCWNEMKKRINSKKEMMGNQMKSVRE